MNLDDQQEEVRGGKGKREDGGATQIIGGRDPMFRKLVSWFWGSLGASFVTVLGLAAYNLYQLNLTVANIAIANAQTSVVMADHEARLRAVEKDLNTVEGKVYRGLEQGKDIVHDP